MLYTVYWKTLLNKSRIPGEDEQIGKWMDEIIALIHDQLRFVCRGFVTYIPP